MAALIFPQFSFIPGDRGSVVKREGQWNSSHKREIHTLLFSDPLCTPPEESQKFRGNRPCPAWLFEEHSGQEEIAHLLQPGVPGWHEPGKC